MIQRIQTIFLALIVILGVLFSFLPILSFSVHESVYVMKAYNTYVGLEMTEILSKNMGVGVLQGLVLIVAFITILLFKNRSLQIKLGKLNILLIALQIAAIVMYSDTAKNAINADDITILLNFKIGAIIPIINLILTYLTIHFIKKDDKLIRDADRLR